MDPDEKENLVKGEEPAEGAGPSVTEEEEETPTRTPAKRPRLQFEGISPQTTKEEDKENFERKLDYLLKKSEYFAHALTTGGGEGKGRGKAPKESSLEVGRHRRSEKEEDDELLKDAEAAAEGAAAAAITFTETPPYIKSGEMRDYQIRGLNWLIQLYDNSINGILADEMGLGKTLQTISFLAFLKHFKGTDGRHMNHIVIVPKSTLSNWEAEFRRWCPSMRTVTLIGNGEARQETIQNKMLKLRAWDVLLTTYEMVRMEKGVLKRVPWMYVVIDEAHRIKNEKSRLSETVRELGSKKRLLITGTPLQNDLHELWALLNFLLPDVFNSAYEFDNYFNAESCFGNDHLVKRLHSVLRPFLLRRIKAEVEKGLPPKREIKLYVPMVKMQREYYKNILSRDLAILNGAGKMEKAKLMNILMHLRKCCNHPYLFDGAEPGPPYTTDWHLVRNSGKLLVLDKLLFKLQAEGSRVLLFTQMTRMLDILEDYCLWRKFLYYRLDGNTAHEDRQRMIDEYNSPDSKTFLFMLSTRAGGLGINLATADVVVLYDSDWNPQMDLQAMDRAHRIGQKKEVRVFRLVIENTVDEKIVEKAAVKLQLDKIVIQQGRVHDPKVQLKNEDLLNWIRFGANLIFSEATGTEDVSDETIDAIISKSKAKTDELDEKLEKLGTGNLKNFSLESQDLFNFEGENYRDKGKSAIVVPPLEWIEPPKRTRKPVVYAEMSGINVKEDDDAGKKKNPKPPRHPNLPDHQFFPRRLHHLLEKEVLYYQQTIKYKVPREQWEDSKEAIKAQKAQQKRIDSAKPLTKEELKEREQLLQCGFTNWTRKDFNTFLKLLGKHGRNNLDYVAEEFEAYFGKSQEEVMEYAKVFKRRFFELTNYEKILAQISKAEEQRMRTETVHREMSKWIRACRNPYLELNIPYGKGFKRGLFTTGNDRFLIVSWWKHRFEWEDDSVWYKIKEEIMSSTEFRFDWFLKSRNIGELKARCLSIWTNLEKEIVTQGCILDFHRKMADAWKSMNAVEEEEEDGDEGEEEEEEEEEEQEAAGARPRTRGSRRKSHGKGKKKGSRASASKSRMANGSRNGFLKKEETEGEEEDNGLELDSEGEEMFVKVRMSDIEPSSSRRGSKRRSGRAQLQD